MTQGTLPAVSTLRDVEIAAEAAALRAQAEARYSEVHLLVAALQDHVRDLRIERDRLLTENARLREASRRQHASWMWRGLKSQQARQRGP